MSIERRIVQRLFESRDLYEAEFQAGGSTYKCAFGKYYKDGEQITREDYFKAKETGSSGGSSEASQGSDTLSPSNSAEKFSRLVDDHAKMAGSKLKRDKNGPYFYDGGDKEKFNVAVGRLSLEFSEAHEDVSRYQLSKSQECYYDKETGMALVIKESDTPGKSWAQVKKLSPEEVSKLKTTSGGTSKKRKSALEDPHGYIAKFKENIESLRDRLIDYDTWPPMTKGQVDRQFSQMLSMVAIYGNEQENNLIHSEDFTSEDISDMWADMYERKKSMVARACSEPVSVEEVLANPEKYICSEGNNTISLYDNKGDPVLRYYIPGDDSTRLDVEGDQLVIRRIDTKTNKVWETKKFHVDSLRVWDITSPKTEEYLKKIEDKEKRIAKELGFSRYTPFGVSHTF